MPFKRPQRLAVGLLPPSLSPLCLPAVRSVWGNCGLLRGTLKIYRYKFFQIRGMMFIMKVGATIKRLRKQKVMTLEQFSELTGIQTATLSRIENDRMNGGLNTYMLIAGGLDLRLSELFAEIEKDNGLG